MVQNPSRRAYWIEVGLFALTATLAYRIGLLRVSAFRPGLLLVFLLPIQMCWVRRGERAGLLASGFLLGALGLIDFIGYLRIRPMADVAGEAVGLVFLDMLPALAFLAGLYLLNTPHLVIRFGRTERDLSVVERMIAAALAAVVVYVPAGLLLNLSGELDGFGTALADEFRAAFPALGATEGEILELVQLAVRMSLSAFVLGFFAMLLGSWWIGTRIALGQRFALRESNDVAERLRGFRVARFRLPVSMVWLVIAAWGGVLLSMLVDVGWLSFVFWNVALLALALYAIQGLGVVWHLLERRKLGRSQRIGVAVGLVIGLIIPGVNLVFLLGLPGLGISEVWVNYHRFEGSGEEK